MGEKRPAFTIETLDAKELYQEDRLPAAEALTEADNALGLSAAAEDRAGRNPPAWVADEAIWKKAKAAVEPRAAEYDEPFAVVTHVYKNMGGRIR